MKNSSPNDMFGKAAIAILIALLPCCVGFTRDITKDRRFAQVLSTDITTKREMRLYHIVLEDSRRSPDLEYDLTESETTDNPMRQLIGTISPGHKVRFNRVYSKTASGETQEWMVGSMTYKGEVYKIEYFLGFTGYGGFTGWKRLYKSFDLGKAPED